MPRRHVNLVGRLVVLVMIVSVVVLAEPAVAQTAPKTLGDRRPIQAAPVEPGFPIDYLGVLWDNPIGHDHGGEDNGPQPHGAVRFRRGGVWGTWHPLIEDGAAGGVGEGQWSSGLVAGDDAEAYQVRGVPADAVGAEAAAINTTDGPRVRVAATRGGTAGASESAKCRSARGLGCR